MSRFLFFAALLLASGWALGEEFTTRVIAVLDGDTVLVLRNGHPAKVRLAEIDAPEKMQSFGETSKRSLSAMVLGKQVVFNIQAVDQYGRLVARLSVGATDVNTEQIRRGMAWEYSHYHSNNSLIKLQNEAKSALRGLWAISDPMPPWEWRKQHPNEFAAHAVPVADNPELLLAGCGDKVHCSQMSSCEEAQHYLNDCGVKSLDGNGDGVPCANLCNGK